MDERTARAGSDLVVRFLEEDYLPHGAMVTWVNGVYYRIEVKRIDPIPGSEEWFVDADTG